MFPSEDRPYGKARKRGIFSGSPETFEFAQDEVVPGAGLEPARSCLRGILSPHIGFRQGAD